MKNAHLIAPFICLLTMSVNPLFSQDKKADEKKSDVYGNVGMDSTLEKLLTIKGVDSIYKDCDKTHGKEGLNKPEEIPGCIWRAVGSNASLKSQVMAVYNESLKGQKKDKTDGGRAPASASDKGMMTARKTAVATDYNSDPTVKALSDLFGSKLNEILDPSAEEAKNGTLISVDHKKFSELYKSELGKNIVNAFTSYCLGTNQADSTCSSTGICEYDEKKYKQTNIDNLKGADFGDKSPDKDRWMNCISAVPQICYEGKAPSAASKTQACLIMDFVKSARKNIMAIDSQDKFYEDLRKNKTTAIAGNFKAMDEEKSKNDVLTQVTSSDLEKEYVKADGTKAKVSDVNEALKKEVEECYDKQNQVKGLDKCKKFLSTSVKENEAAIAEFGIRQEIQGEQLKEKLTDAAAVTAYLKEEGFEDDKIKAMTDAGNLEKTKQEILDRFKAEKEAFIAHMRQKVEDKTSSKEGDISQDDSSKMDKIKASFANRTTDLGNLIKFNNVVSSYLEVGDAKDKNAKLERNTASLFAEVQNMKGDEAAAYKKSLESAKLTDKKNNSNLDVKQINDILKYKTQPADKKTP